RAFLCAAPGMDRPHGSSAPNPRAGADRSQSTVATTRVRKEGPRPLSVTERRWLLEQLLRRQTSEQAAGEPAATAKEASSMIGRPSSTATDPFAGGATGSGSAPVDPTVSPIAPPRFAERGAEPTAVPARPVEPGSEPTAAPAAPPRPTDQALASASPSI